MTALEVSSDVHARVLRAIEGVHDPEYPGISIVEVGLVESVEVDEDGAVSVGLIPTFSGCPALGIIASDVHLCLIDIPGVNDVDVRWLRAPMWTVDRISERTRAQLAKEFTVSIRIGTAAPLCPRCGADTAEQSMFGPSRCRSVNRCTACGEIVEVMRS